MECADGLERDESGPVQDFWLSRWKDGAESQGGAGLGQGLRPMEFEIFLRTFCVDDEQVMGYRSLRF